MRMRLIEVLRGVLCSLLLLGMGCSSGADITAEQSLPKPKPELIGFARGADISWVTQLEAEGYTFYNSAGQERECTALMQELGMDAIRLRVWVDPEEGWCGREDLLVKARRAQRLGMRLMVDFHYSDSWADPGKQYPPQAWVEYDLEQLKEALSSHTREVLSALHREGIAVEWVQVGNETSNGMLWPLGQCDRWPANYAALHNAGYEAVKSLYPEAKVVVHLHNGHDKSLYNWLFGELEREGARYDLIGMSLYPGVEWQAMAEACVENIRAVNGRFGKEVIICEVGMPWDAPDATYDFLSWMLRETAALGCVRGLFYWEPEAPAGYNGGYTLGAFADGRPTHALDAFGE